METNNKNDIVPTDNNICSQRILIAEDQIELLFLLKQVFEHSGFTVCIAEDGQEALNKVFSFQPDLIILDYKMPMLNGLQVTEALKNNPLFLHIPIIICTAYGDKEAKLKGLTMGIDDYLIKPVDTDELLTRVRMILKRNKQVLDTNPLTKLPGNPSIHASIERRIIEKSKFAVLYIDLNNFKAYNDKYGFDAGDRVLKTTANILVKQIIHGADSRDFIGNIGGDDFIVVTDYSGCIEMAEGIIKTFDKITHSFYTKEDSQRGYIVSTDRQGNVKNFPLLSVAIGIVHNNLRPITSFAQVSNIGAELKKYAKKSAKSSYIIDRRSS